MLRPRRTPVSRPGIGSGATTSETGRGGSGNQTGVGRPKSAGPSLSNRPSDGCPPCSVVGSPHASGESATAHTVDAGQAPHAAPEKRVGARLTVTSPAQSTVKRRPRSRRGGPCTEIPGRCTGGVAPLPPDLGLRRQTRRHRQQGSAPRRRQRRARGLRSRRSLARPLARTLLLHNG